MKVLKKVMAGVLAGVVTASAITGPVQAAVYEEVQPLEAVSLNQAEESSQEAGNAVEILTDEEETLPDESPDGGTGEYPAGISDNGMPSNEEGGDPGEGEEGEDPVKNEEVNPEVSHEKEIDLLDQEELDRALEQGLVEFLPNEEISLEGEPRAGAAGGDLITVASREVGISGCPNKYTYWLGTIGGTYAYAWCHAFVSWCAAQAGASGQIPRTASCFMGVQEFKAKGHWQNRISGYVPKSGDIIYFDWDANGGYDHVGIVNYVSGGRVHTIEGNAGNAVRIDGGRTGGYALTDSQIIGYGVPDYRSDSNIQACVDSVVGGTGCVQVRGWAFDKSSVTQALDIRVYVGGPADSGAPGYTITADKKREDVGTAYPGTGSQHGFEDTIYVSQGGTQTIYIYASYAAKNVPDLLLGYWTVDITADTKKPVIKNIKISDISAEGYTVTCKVTDNVGIDRVMFPSWHESKTGDQAVWLKGTVTDGKAECFIPIEQLGGESGVYTTHVYAYDRAGNYSLAAAEAVTIDIASLNFYKEQNLSTDFEALITHESSEKVLGVQEENVRPLQETEDKKGQIWVFRREGDSSYTIQSKLDGRYLAASSADTGSEIVLTQEESGRLWKIYRAGESSYYLKPENSENSVMAPAGTDSGKSSFALYSFAASAEQRFKIRKLSTNVSKISLNPSEIKLAEIGQTETITASIEPQSAADEKVCWQSSNEKTASVDKNGKVTAVGNGTTDITASTEDGSLSAVCKVTVAVKVTGVSLNKQQLKLTSVGEVKKLSAAVMPADAYNQTITWNSSNKKAALVDQTGKVTAVADGTADITAQSSDGTQKAVCKVSVQIPQIGAGGKATSGSYTYSADFVKDSSNCKTVIYRQKNGGSKTKLAQISGEAYLRLVYGGKLYYEKVTSSGKRNLCAMDTKTFAKQTVRSNASIIGSYGRRFLVMPYTADPMPQPCYVLNVVNGKAVQVSAKCLGAVITSKKVFYVEAVSGKTAKGWKGRVRSCKWTGKNGKYVTGKLNVSACEKVTAKYIVYQTGKSRYKYVYASKKKTKLQGL